MYTTQDMIAEVQILGSFPTASDLFSPSDYLRIFQREMLDVVVPLMVAVNEEFFLEYQDQAIVAGQSAYRLPKRAIVSGLRDVQLFDSSKSVTALGRLYEDDRTSLDNNSVGYFLKGNQVIVSPTPTSSTGTLRQAYFRRPQTYVLPVACAQITSINTGLSQVTVASVPSNFTNGTLVDFCQGDTPYDTLAFDQAIVSVSGATVAFVSLPTNLAVGDYISIAGQSCVPGCPEELVPLLVQSALVVCLSSKKDQALQVEAQKRQDMKMSLLNLLAPRVKSDDAKITNPRGILSRFTRYR